MLALFASLKANVPFARKAGSAQAEGIVNRLHYRQGQSGVKSVAKGVIHK